MRLVPRYYQSAAVESVWEALKRRASPVVEIPTAGGKALCIAMLCERVLAKGGRVLVATHSQELVEANAKEFESLTKIEPGVLCAGLDRDDKDHDVLFVSVQSIYRPAKSGDIKPFNLIIVDECHWVSDQDSDAKFYNTLFKSFPDALRVGFSATPSRMSIPVWGENKWFTERCYSVSVLELIEKGFLCPLIGVVTAHKIDVDKLSHVAGEFDVKSIEKQETREWLTQVAKTTKTLAEGRKHILVFCPSVSTAEEAAKCFTEAGLPAEYVVADTDDREGNLSRWKAGEFPVMCNVSILTTGFNFPALSCGVILRPTESGELWKQMLGRFTRIHHDKKNALILDFSSNLMIHGGICAGVEEVYEQSKKDEFRKVDSGPKERKLRAIKKADTLTDLDPMLATPKGARAKVKWVDYIVINSKQQLGKRILMVSYNCELSTGRIINASEFVCVEYSGYARGMAEEWFKKRGETYVPRQAEEARKTCYGLPTPREVSIRKNGKYFNIVGTHF